MQPNTRTLLRVADCIRSQLHRAAAPPEIELPEAHWTECQALMRQLARATERGWINAAAILQDRLERALKDCSERLQEIVRQVSSSYRRPAPPTVRDVFRDLAALSEEFEGFSVDMANRTISVTTEPIVLEEINLGPFEVRMRWDRIGERRSYDVIALEPNPSGESSDVTHPHVRAEQLCEGDGRTAIDRALRSGRLVDFFQIVARILNTYNSGSAYVSLSQWNGLPCSDCGDLLSEDDRSACDRCEDVLCLDCLMFCARCDNRCCHSCTDHCRSCESQLCPGCQRSCDGCDRIHCSDCLSENALCEECQEQDDANTLNEDENSPDETPAPVTPPSGEPHPVASPDSAAV